MLSRRALLTLAGVAGLAPRAHAAETTTKVTKTAAKYQDKPNIGQTCGMCKFYIAPGGRAGGGMMGGQGMMRGQPGGGGMMSGGHMGGDGHMGAMMAPGTCEVVEGSVSPQGWCVSTGR
jgi:hypothetical protein